MFYTDYCIAHSLRLYEVVTLRIPLWLLRLHRGTLYHAEDVMGVGFVGEDAGTRVI